MPGPNALWHQIVRNYILLQLMLSEPCQVVPLIPMPEGLGQQWHLLTCPKGSLYGGNPSSLKSTWHSLRWVHLFFLFFVSWLWMPQLIGTTKKLYKKLFHVFSPWIFHGFFLFVTLAFWTRLDGGVGRIGCYQDRPNPLQQLELRIRAVRGFSFVGCDVKMLDVEEKKLVNWLTKKVS